MSEIKISTGHPDAGRIYAEALDRVTAERDAGLAREAALTQNLKYAEQGYLSIAESADASAQTLHEVISRLKAERDALQSLLTAADEKIADFPTILFEHCNFQGLNSDGSPVFEFTGGFPNKIKSIRMIGWVCEGPRKAVELQVSFPALKP